MEARVGIEPPSATQTRKLLIPRSCESCKTDTNAELRYTAGTRTDARPGLRLTGSQTTLAGFAELHHLRPKLDESHDPIVRGKLGHLYEHDASRFGIVLQAPPDSTRLDRTLRARKLRAIAAGFLLHQEGDCEAILLFDPADVRQAGLAIRLIQAKRIRQAAQPTDAQVRARALFSSRARSGRP